MQSSTKTLLLTFFLQGPFPPGTASQSLLMASLIMEMKKGQRSKVKIKCEILVLINWLKGHIYDLDIMWIYGDCAPTYIMVTGLFVSITEMKSFKCLAHVQGYTNLLQNNKGKT